MELNEKLARWAGLVMFTDKFGIVYEYQASERERKPMMRKEPPNFTESLDACFKWLVPKLEAQKFRMMITYNNIKRPDKEYMYRVSFCKFKTNSLGKAYDKDLALALCKAIEKLIEDE